MFKTFFCRLVRVSRGSLKNVGTSWRGSQSKPWIVPRGKGAGALSLAVGGLLLQSSSQAPTVTGEKEGITAEEVRKHSSIESGIWIVLNGQVYDVSDYAEGHPGGRKILLMYAGKDASLAFNARHAEDFPTRFLTPEMHLGPLIGEMEVAEDILEDMDEERIARLHNLPPLTQVMCASDFEYIARKILPPAVWNYYSTGSDDEVTLRENHNAFSRVFFKPRVLRNVESVDMSTNILGKPSTVPFYCSGAGNAKLGHRDGELSIARACGKEGIVQMVTNYASYKFDEIFGQINGQTQMLQAASSSKAEAQTLIDYATRNRDKVDGVFINVDIPTGGNREKHFKFQTWLLDAEKAIALGHDFHVPTWDDIEEFQTMTPLPLGLKGVQSAEDVVLSAEKGVKAVILSNHGGRQLDFSRAPLEVLADAMPMLREKGLDGKIEIYIDGGVRRGSDILKAIALGAKGVGLGRMFLYANTCYGEAGVRHLINILKHEIETDMKLVGVSKLEELTPEHLDLRNLHMRYPVPDMHYYRNYEGPPPPKFRNE